MVSKRQESESNFIGGYGSEFFRLGSQVQIVSLLKSSESLIGVR
jgi:hypothetical protein